MDMKRFKKALIALLVFGAGAGYLRAQGIFDAVKANDLAGVKAMIGKDASLLRAKDAAGMTPLHVAAANGWLPIAELLLAQGADLNAVNIQLKTPLHVAIENEKDMTARLLIEKGSDLGKKDFVGDTPLHAAVNGDRTNIVELLVAKKAEVESRNGDQFTPFMLAARNTGNVEIGRLLLRNGANINTKDNFSYTPLNWAAFFGQREFIEFLLDNKGDFDGSEGKGLEILRKAAQLGSARLFRFVSEKENTLFDNGKVNDATMYTAMGGGSVEIVNMLMAKNIPVKHLRNHNGWRPIHQAASNGHLAMIRFLVEHGADINARTLSGKSAYNLADEAGKKEMLELILQLGGQSSPQQFPDLNGPYLGQTVPDREPKTFAPDIVVPNHSSITGTRGGNEFYWQSPEGTIWTTRLENGKWSKPEAVPFSDMIKGQFTDDVPFISPDEKKMFFTSTRPVGSAAPGKENIWVVEKTPAGWSAPKPLGAEVNGMLLHWQVSVANSGTLYFSGTGPDGYGEMDLYCSRLIDGQYSKPLNLGSVINGPSNDGYPYIAPDESYIIYGKGVGWDFSISFKGEDGQWLPPAKLSQSLRGFCPVVSPDGKYFFYVSNGIQWVDAGFIEELRPKR